jgi:hypothetical protein
MRKIFLTIFLTILILPVTASAVLELDFPGVEDANGNLIKPEGAFGPANWINYIFVFGLGVVGLVIIGSLVYAGFEWMTGAENPSKVQSARDRIMGSVIGLIILLGSYVFLNTINPQLVSLKNPRIMMNVESEWRNIYRQHEEEEPTVIGAGAACALPSDCREGYTCTEGKCVEVTEKFTGKECQLVSDCDRQAGERCFQKTGGDIINPNDAITKGVCSSLKAIGETCNPDATTNECMGKCDATLKRCVRI